MFRRNVILIDASCSMPSRPADAVCDGHDAALVWNISSWPVSPVTRRVSFRRSASPQTYRHDLRIHKENRGRNGVVGLMNIQYAIADDIVTSWEANPVSRTVPLVSKVCNIEMASLATRMIGDDRQPQRQAAAVYSFRRQSCLSFTCSKKSTRSSGLKCVDRGSPDFRLTGLAFFKAVGTAAPLPTSGTVLITVARRQILGNRRASRFAIVSTFWPPGTQSSGRRRNRVGTVMKLRDAKR